MPNGKGRTAALLASLASVFHTPPIRADWTIVNLHPGGQLSSWIHAVDGGRQGGESLGNPGFWSGSGSSWTALAPSHFGAVHGMSGGVQVGVIGVGLASHAALWRGTPESLVDLHPAGVPSSQALAVYGDQQVGYIHDGRPRAALWYGTAESFVNLNPPGPFDSYARGTDGVHQYGEVYNTLSGVFHAVRWSGSAASMVSLHPAGAGRSRLHGVAPGQQVGEVDGHAALWSGTAASFVDLNPPGRTGSVLFATCGSAQVGMANFGSLDWRPGIWFGTAQSFTPLPVPAGYTLVEVRAVESFNGQYYIGGSGRNEATGAREALLWVGVPAPGTAAVLGVAGVAAARRRRR